MCFIPLGISRKLSPREYTINTNNRISKAFLFVPFTMVLSTLHVQPISIQIGHFSYRTTVSCGQWLLNWTTQISHLCPSPSVTPSLHTAPFGSHAESSWKHLHTLQPFSSKGDDNADTRVKRLLVCLTLITLCTHALWRRALFYLSLKESVTI